MAAVLLLSILAAAACKSDPSDVETERPHALLLDGLDDYVQVADVPALDVGTGDFTWETWVRRSRTGLREDVLNKKDVFADAEHDLGLLIDAGGRANAFLGQDANSQVYLMSTSLIGTAWTHLAATRKDGLVTLYVNGVAEASQRVTYDLSSTGPLRIGANRVNNAGADADAVFAFAGLIDEVRLWSTARTPQQIRDGMQKRVATDATGLVAYYRFNEGEGTRAHDASAGGHTGLLVNGAGWAETTGSPAP